MSSTTRPPQTMLLAVRIRLAGRHAPAVSCQRCVPCGTSASLVSLFLCASKRHTQEHHQHLGDLWAAKQHAHVVASCHRVTASP